jgi:nicotinate phosphoribosyltransferase
MSLSTNSLVEHFRITAAEFVPPVQSLLDVDFYKFLMMQLILEKHPDVEVTFKLIVRDDTIPIGRFVPLPILAKCLDHVMGLQFEPTDLAYLRGINLYDGYLFKDKFIQFLRTFKLPPYRLDGKGDSWSELTFKGSWTQVTLWETMALAVVSELYYRGVMRSLPVHELHRLYDSARVHLYTKFDKLLLHPGILFADFGQRRRHSFLWQKWVLWACKRFMGAQFTGTSNTWMAFHHNLTPIGTNAHELPMVYVALASKLSPGAMVDAQYQVLKDWESIYGKGLRILLPDTYTSEQFFRNAPDWVADWRGMRQDSADPIEKGEIYLEWLKQKGADPKDKLIIFSDGLDVDPIVKIHDHFAPKVKTPLFGWGTHLTNDFGAHQRQALIRPFSMVCKAVEADGYDCVKLSDNIQKATGGRHMIDYYKEAFQVGQLSNQRVVV